MVFNTGHLTEMRLKNALESALIPVILSGDRCLDVGCGDRPYEYLFDEADYVGIDIGHPPI